MISGYLFLSQSRYFLAKSTVLQHDFVEFSGADSQEREFKAMISKATFLFSFVSCDAPSTLRRKSYYEYIKFRIMSDFSSCSEWFLPSAIL